MLFQNLKAIGEELSEICVLFCMYIYIFIYIDYSAKNIILKSQTATPTTYISYYCF
jgi:cytochrome c biogenesis factor